MNEFQKRALDLLDELLAAPATKRFTRLLPCPQSDSGAIEKGLRDLPWSEGWAFDVQDSMASRLCSRLRLYSSKSQRQHSPQPGFPRRRLWIPAKAEM